MAATLADEGLNVIALVSGGKDSFYSLLHCRANGHRVVALANLHPAPRSARGDSAETPTPSPAASASAAPAASAAVPAPALEPAASTLTSGPRQDQGPGPGCPERSSSGRGSGAAGNEVMPKADDDERDLNSFMYQTVGHQVIPLYSKATGIPLFRRPIIGSATQLGKEYSHHRSSSVVTQPRTDPTSDGPRDGPRAGSGSDRDSQRKPENQAKGSPSASAGRGASKAGNGVAAEGTDETESMVPLLEEIKKAHPEANAICAGAILSTYQRTRVESVATRLGLTPLAYLWNFPVLPNEAPSDRAVGTDAQLLDDMAAVGLEARIVKVSSGGLDESFLWTNVATAAGKDRIAKAMRRFGPLETGAVIGEGGEFETLVLDGPSTLFKKRIVVSEEDKRVVKEGGGSAWLNLRNARLEDKVDGKGNEDAVRIPGLLDARFAKLLDELPLAEPSPFFVDLKPTLCPDLGRLQQPRDAPLKQWRFIGPKSTSIEVATLSLVKQIRQRLQEHSLSPSAILSAAIVLRQMADFSAVNNVYGTLFNAPNPASRVTISCGDAILDAADTDIAVYLTVHTGLQTGQRQGLHVQSRSYWAPANIGPYSQAISIPVGSLRADPASNLDHASSSYGARLVSVAGQIPLIPATMSLPVDGSDSIRGGNINSRNGSRESSADGGSSKRPDQDSENSAAEDNKKSADGGGSETVNEDKLRLQFVLSLQHLWRIGVEMGVQWWTSAVAFIPAGTPQQAQKKANLAARVWKRAHTGESSRDDDKDEGDDEAGPDLWDRRFNPAYRSFAAINEQDDKKSGQALPDRSILLNSPTLEGIVPPMFVAEVNELPRGADIEWHAHLGIAGAPEGSVITVRRLGAPSPPDRPKRGRDHGRSARADSVGTDLERLCGAWHIVVRDKLGRTSFVQTIVAEHFDAKRAAQPGMDRAVYHRDVAARHLGHLGVACDGDNPIPLEDMAVAMYVDASQLLPSSPGFVGPLVPCRSLWDDKGARLAAVSVYQSVFQKD
ncbi:hypothetical protein VTK26DRAFT_2942 [Humicola hyalothermophila]